MVIPKINSAHGSDTRNILNRAIDLINAQGKSIQDLVAEGQLTPQQYAELVSIVNGNVKKGSITSADIDKNNFTVDQTMISDSLRQMIVGDTPINAVPADGSLTDVKYAYKSMSLNKLSDSVQALIPSYLESGAEYRTQRGGINLTTGAGTSHTNRVNLDAYFKADEDVHIAINSADTEMNIFFYNDTWSYIGNSGWLSGDYILEKGINYRWVLRYKDDREIPVEYDIDENITLYKKGVSEEFIRTQSISHDKLKSNVLFGQVLRTNQNCVIDFDFNEKIITIVNARVIQGNKSYYATSTTPAIDISECTEYTNYVIYFDTSIQWGGFGVTLVNDMDIPENGFVVGSFHPINKKVTGFSEYTINGGADPLKEAVKNMGGSHSIASREYPLEIDRMTEIRNVSEGTVMNNYTSSDVFDLYDNFVDDTYVTKELFFQESTGLPAYRYNLRPKEVPVRGYDKWETKKPHLFLVAGVHPSESNGIWSLYNVINLIINHWKEDEILQTLRWDVNISVIPIVNVWGFDNGEARNNSNGVDINRNYPADWEASDPTRNIFSGPEPASEIETQKIISVIENEDIDFYGDFHNFFTHSDVNAFLWSLSSSQFISQVSENLITHISHKWKREFPEFPQEDDVLFGTSSQPGNGSPIKYCAQHDVHASVFEICQRVNFLPYPNNTNLTSQAATLGVDAQLNYLYQIYKNL